MADRLSLGCRIIEKIDRPDRAVVEKFRGLPSSNINDCLGRLYCMHGYIQPQNDRFLLGTAFTVKVPIGDNLFLHKALEMAQPGDVIVVDGGSGINRSLAGEIMISYLEQRGIAGIVVDGCLRDEDALRRMSIPVYCTGITPQGPYKNGPGEINVPIACGGQVVFPGDILVGDADGIVVVRKEYAEEVAAAGRAKFDSEAIQLSDIQNNLSRYAAEHFEYVENEMKKCNPVILSSCT